MCRIVGWWDLRTNSLNPKPNYKSQADQVINKMLLRLRHGGPDGSGVFISEQTPLVLGHCRLSILDLSLAGRQPMAYKDWQITFNGEIYNFQEIRQALIKIGYTFNTQTDTEILLKGFEAWGMDKLLQQCRGMFSFVIWNERKQEIFLVRDRLGVKPLFVYSKDGLYMWASELKSFHEHPDFDKTISPKAVNLYLQYGYIPQPNCIFQYVEKVQGGCYWQINKKGVKKQTYWSAANAFENKLQLPDNENELQHHVEKKLSEAFNLRMVADVEVGAFLSGGVDSSLVVAMLQKDNPKPLQTFTMGFDDPAYNEAEHAKKIAQYLGTTHNEIYCKEQDFLDVVPNLSNLYDEPFGDSSAVPTYLIAKLAKSKVKVSLSADGGDELFGGYTKYEATQRYMKRIQPMPKFVKNTMAGMLSWFSPQWLERNSKFIPVLGRYKNLNHKVPKLVEALQGENLQDFFERGSSYAKPELLQNLLSTYTADKLILPNLSTKSDDLISYLGLCDMLTYLEGDIMTKVDRATMHCALEGREPFLDHHLVELALSLQDKHKINEGKTKYLLRNILYKYVPKELIDRPKQGFAVPIEKWLRTVLKNELVALTEDKIFFEKLPLQQNEVAILIDKFLSEKEWVNPHFIWFIYMLWQWQKRWLA